MSNRQWLAILMLALVASGTRWWLLQMQDADRQAARLPDARSEYTLENFDLLVMDESGLPSFRIEAPHLEKMPEDGAVIIEQPMMYLFDQGRKTWRIDAQSGWVRPDGQEVLLGGEVLMTRDEGKGQLLVETSDLTILPQQKLANSSEPVRMSRPGMVMAGVGLRATLDPEKFELLSEVKGRYEPQQTN